MRDGETKTAGRPGRRAQDDLYACVNAEWEADTPLGAAQSMVSTFTQVQLATERAVRSLLDETGDAPAGGVVPMAETFQRSWLDRDGVEVLGRAVLDPLLDRIHRIRDHEDFYRLCGEFYRRGVVMPVRHYVDVVLGDGRLYRSNFTGSVLPLPLDAYEPANRAELDSYRRDIERLMSSATGRPDADAWAAEVVGLETELSVLYRAAAGPARPAETLGADELRSLHPTLVLFLDGAGIELGPHDRVNVEQPDLFDGLAALLGRTPGPTLRSYALWCVLTSLAPYLPTSIASVWTTLNERAGTQRWLRRGRRAQGEYLTHRAFGHALGEIYAARHVDGASRDDAWRVVERIVVQYGEVLRACEWLGPAARTAALEKLERMGVAFVAPSSARDYSAAELREDRLLDNYHALVEHEVGCDVKRIGREASPDHWWINPIQVNAYYDIRTNRIAIPAAILQEPFFSVSAVARNMGGLGAVIAHELTHAFDERGVRLGADGIVGSWWGPEEEEAFRSRTAELVRQFDGARRTDFPEIAVDGRLTLNENIADLSGLSVAVGAYLRYCDEAGASEAERKDGARELFRNWARLWRQKVSPRVAAVSGRSDPHAPGEIRCNQVVRNLDEFHWAFDVQPDDEMWLAPAERVRVW
ncbi:M13-type metalloendopeptidase [Planobispora takensis]|uniref:Putative zinc metalloprotease n=1 Tax=Planobispora takensis TaxID=1367882 RepID=A0A8J3WQ88_9ACTN|nr:M13 family metallopeptidase [Planobispora takensis]GIH98193.1 putative zinc metalloprotease [Planobispora takensis]